MSQLDLQKLRELRREERELRERVDMAVSGMDGFSSLKQPQRRNKVGGGIDGRNSGNPRCVPFTDLLLLQNEEELIVLHKP